jgi:hypothetical protein
MAIRRLGLTRDQLASFLQEHEQIRQFELLFTAVDEIQTNGLDAVTYDAGAALAGVNKLAGVVAQLAQDGAIEASNALSVAQAAERALVAVEGLAMVGATLPPKVPVRRAVGSWSDASDQTATLPNVAYAVSFDTTAFERATWVDPASRDSIYVADAGVFNFEFSAQVDKTSGGTALLWIWARVNGVDVPDSAGEVRIQGNSSELVVSWNWLLELAPGDAFQIMWAVDDTSVRLEHFPAAAPVPAIPSVILTVTQEG